MRHTIFTQANVFAVGADYGKPFPNTDQGSCKSEKDNGLDKTKQIQEGGEKDAEEKKTEKEIGQWNWWRIDKEAI